MEKICLTKKKREIYFWFKQCLVKYDVIEKTIMEDLGKNEVFQQTFYSFGFPELICLFFIHIGSDNYQNAIQIMTES